jgi:hypothetical protein
MGSATPLKHRGANPSSLATNAVAHHHERPAPWRDQQGPHAKRPPPQSWAGVGVPPGATQCTLQSPARSQTTQPSANLTLQLETSLQVTRHPFRQSTLQALARLQSTAQFSPHETAQLDVSWQLKLQSSTHSPPQREARAQSTRQPRAPHLTSQESRSRQMHSPTAHRSSQSSLHPGKKRS